MSSSSPSYDPAHPGHLCTEDVYESSPYEVAIPLREPEGAPFPNLDAGMAMASARQDHGQLRVLMVTPFYGDGGGVGNVSKELTEKLLSNHIVVEVLHWWPNFNNPAFIDAKQNRIALSSVVELLNSDRQYDLLHFQSAAFSDRINGGLSKILSRYRVPIVYTIHSLAAYHGQIMNNLEAMRNNIGDQAELMEKSARVALLTDDLEKIAARCHPEHAARFMVTPNGTNLPTYTPEDLAERERLRGLLNPDNQARILLYVGRISHEKGIYELVAAFPEIKRRHPDAKLVIAGNKPHDPNVQKIKDSLGQAGLVPGQDFDFAGWVDGITKSALYELADLVIMPSYYEHMPLTALEAMARRKPVLIADIESLRLTFHTHDPMQRCVLPIARIKDVQAIVDAVSYALREPEEVARIVARAYQRIVERYTWDTVVKRWIDQYKAVLITAREEQIQQLRSELQTTFGDDQRIAAMQGVSEELRRLRAEEREPGPVAEISAVMPVFLRRDRQEQGLHFLAEAIDSVIGQVYSHPYELVIVDDGSEIDVVGFVLSRYPKLVREIRSETGELRHRCDAPEVEPRTWIRIITKPENSGNDVAPRNLGIVSALLGGSRYITHIDSDDRMPPGRLQTSYDYLERRPDTDLLHGRHRCIDEQGQVISGSAVDGWFNFARRFTFGIDQYDPANEGRGKRHDKRELEILSKDNWIHGGTVTYRSNVIWRVGLQNLKPTQRYGADHVFWQKLSRVATIDFISTILTEHRLHGGSMTQGGR